MAKAKISKSVVDALEPGSKDQFYWDEKLSGFGLKVTPPDNTAHLLQYRIGGRGSPTCRYTIGGHGNPSTAAEARDEAERLLARVRQGSDPLNDKAESERRRAESELAFATYAQKFLTDYAGHEWKASRNES